MEKLYAVCKTLNAGYDYDRRKIKESGIKIGDKIETKHISVGDWHTDVWLVGYKDVFNSVFFDFVDENGNEYNIYDDEDFYDTYY